MIDRTPTLNIGLLQEQSPKDNLPKLNQLGKLYDLRGSKGTQLRWGVKDRTITLPPFFSNLSGFLSNAL
ncbi:MAG: hypothetical protein QMC17_02660, partial [Paracoccaceae bacterium]